MTFKTPPQVIQRWKVTYPILRTQGKHGVNSGMLATVCNLVKKVPPRFLDIDKFKKGRRFGRET